MQYLGSLNPGEQRLLQLALDSVRDTMRPSWEASIEEREIFWINLWQESADPAGVALHVNPELDAWVRTLTMASYPGLDVELNGYGFSVNPVGSRTQKWHVDYALDYSNLFIPMTHLTPANSTQYLYVSSQCPAKVVCNAMRDLDDIDINALLTGTGWVEVRQTLANAHAILKMDFGTIHRGPTNTDTQDRLMFWISVRKQGSRPAAVEPPVQTIVAEKR